VELPTFVIDGFGPLPMVRPTSSAEVGDLVRRAVAENQAVYPVGGGTMLDFGFPPTKPGVAIDMRALDRVIDYPARDMTITVQAGITIAKLQALLATEHQQLPIDVPLPEQATLGGAIAVNASGPRRYGYGTLRDYVIGITFINDEGHEVKAGGRVVKNVAGYDLMKLHIGALGTLGIVTQVTLKLKPLPAMRAMFSCACAEAHLSELLDRLHASTTRSVSIELVTPSPDRNDCQIMIGFEDNVDAVEWQVRQLRQEMTSPPSICQLGAQAAEPSVACAPGWLASPCAFIYKANLLPSRLAAFHSTARRLPYAALRAYPGIFLGHADDLTLEQAQTMLTTLLDAAGPDGNVVVLRCPTAWKRELPIWGKPRGDKWLMRRVKEAFDPRGVFNPGRFVDGI
jgi:glycolate oxidase FAD binding subunit